MNRREAIQKTALALGFALSAPMISAVLNGCKATPDLVYKPDFFSEDQARLVSELAEIILPRTTTPGAKDVGVPGFIDTMLKEVYTKEDQDKFLKGLADFDADAKKTYGDSFVECDHDEQVAHVKKYHEDALGNIGNAGATGWWNAGSGGGKPFILKIKELTLLGFFTSKPGATEVLQYNQVPGPYQGCLPLAEVGKAWAT